MVHGPCLVGRLCLSIDRLSPEQLQLWLRMRVDASLAWRQLEQVQFADAFADDEGCGASVFLEQ
eukprot:11479013-Prorocentrum_lima.AAC.1